MELSSAVLKGLQAAGSTVISDQVYKSLATQAVQDSITPADSSELKSESPHFWNVYPDRLFVWDSLLCAEGLLLWMYTCLVLSTLPRLVWCRPGGAEGGSRLAHDTRSGGCQN